MKEASDSLHLHYNTEGGKCNEKNAVRCSSFRYKEVRPQHQLRAFADEWEMIKDFARLVKHVSKEECALALKALEDGAFKK